MATKNETKKRDNIIKALNRPKAALSSLEMIRRTADIWAELGWPQDERPMALRWAGSLEKLHKFLEDRVSDNLRLKQELRVVPMDQSVKDRILDARAAFEAGEPAPTALDLSRELSLPVSVVYHVADGEPQTDSGIRPWVRR
jgi:hypothetical protein